MGWFGSNKSYKSTNHTKFAVGEIVEYASSDIFKIHTDYLKAEVTDVQTEKSGWFNKEFVYTIKLDKNDKIIKNVYESELERYYDGVKHYYPDLHNTETDHLVFAIPREGVDFSLYSDNILEITYNAETKKYSMWVDIDYPRYFYFYEKLAPFMYNLCASPKEVNEKWEKISLPITMAGPDHLEGDIWTSNSLWVLYGNLLTWKDADKEFRLAHLPHEKISRFNSEEDLPPKPKFRYIKLCSHCGNALLGAREWILDFNQNDKNEKKCPKCGASSFKVIENSPPFNYSPIWEEENK